MKKGFMCAAAAAIVIASACVVVIPKVEAHDVSSGSGICDESTSEPAKHAIEIKADLFKMSSPIAAQFGIKNPDTTITQPDDVKKLLNALRKSEDVKRLLSPVFSTVEDREATISVSNAADGKGICISACPQILSNGLISVDAKVRFISKPAAPASGATETLDPGASQLGPADLAISLDMADGGTVVAVGPMVVGTDVFVLAVTPRIMKGKQ